MKKIVNRLHKKDFKEISVWQTAPVFADSFLFKI